MMAMVRALIATTFRSPPNDDLPRLRREVFNGLRDLEQALSIDDRRSGERRVQDRRAHGGHGSEARP